MINKELLNSGAFYARNGNARVFRLARLSRRREEGWRGYIEGAVDDMARAEP
jgi:hypothetical protein